MKRSPVYLTAALVYQNIIGYISAVNCDMLYVMIMFA